MENHRPPRSVGSKEQGKLKLIPAMDLARRCRHKNHHHHLSNGPPCCRAAKGENQEGGADGCGSGCRIIHGEATMAAGGGGEREAGEEISEGSVQEEQVPMEGVKRRVDV